MSEHPLSLDLVLSENALPIPLATDEAQALVATLNPLAKKIEGSKLFAETMIVKGQGDCDNADSFCLETRNRIKTVQAAIKPFKDEAKRRHSMWCDLEALFVEPFTAAGKTVKTKRDVYTAEQQRLRDEAQRKLDEEARLKREEQERIARVAAQKAEDARRAEEAARQAAAAEQDAAKRKQLEAEAEKRRKEAEAAAAKEQKHAEKAASVFAPQLAAVEARKGARQMWVAELSDLEAFLKAAVADPNLRGYITVDITKLARGKSANTMLSVPGIVFSTKTV